MRSYRFALLILLLHLSGWSHLQAQVGTGSDLYRQIMRSDSLLFEAGYNNCDLQALDQLTGPDFVFYHDQAGITRGKEAFIEGIRKNICSLDYRPMRKLMEGSTRIYPLQANGSLYGAIQNGTHAFYAREEDKTPYLTSTAQFTHLWIREEGDWILKTVLSYNHQSPEGSVSQREDLPDGSTAEMEHWLKENQVPALGMALLKDSILIKVAVYGELYPGKVAPLDALFNVASLTKPLVALLTLKLVDSGSWDLDQPVYHYYTDPDVRQDARSRQLTTRHILAHQTGFKNWRWENESGKLQFDFEPGTDFRYSGEGFEYLKKALEAKFDKPLEELADSLLLEPLEMDDTQFHWTDNTDESRFARWHDQEGNTYPTQKNTSASAADDLLTTLADYGRFAQHVLNGGGLSDTLFRQMTTRQNGEEHPIAMGLGWEILPDLKGDEYALLHTGGDQGVNTLIMLLPRTGEGIVLFTNGDNGKNLFFPLVEEHLSLGKQITGRAE